MQKRLEIDPKIYFPKINLFGLLNIHLTKGSLLLVNLIRSDGVDGGVEVERRDFGVLLLDID